MEIKKYVVSPGQEIMKTLAEEFKKDHLQWGAIVSIIGAVDSFCISNMPKNAPKEDILTKYHEPCELSATGEIRDGKPHIHATLSREGDAVLHGHLHWAKVETWFVNVYVFAT